MDVKWFRIGKGKKLHAVSAPQPWTICGVGGLLSGPENPDGQECCKTCLRRIK